MLSTSMTASSNVIGAAVPNETLVASAVVIAVIVLHLLWRIWAKPQGTGGLPSGEFDYIIVGGGLAGSVLAARLSEDPSKRVLVIETGTASPNNLFIRISGAILKLFRNPQFDWCWQTVAEAGCVGRRIFLCRGKLLGGSTCLNAQLAFRGAPRDYDSWGTGWTSDDMGAEFERIELRDREPMKSCGMHVQEPNYQHELSKRFLRACSTHGNEMHPDLKRRINFNDWNASPSGDASGAGFGRFELSQREGTRWTGANSYLAVAASRPNVTVLTGYSVARVTLASAESRHIATGVALKNVTVAKRAEREATARAEVKRTLSTSVVAWRELLRASREAVEANGNRSGAGRAAKYAAARTIITNHEAVLRDMTNPEPLTQHDVARIHPSLASHADRALQEIAYRLLSSDEHRSQSSVSSSPEQAAAVSAVAQYLDKRLQTTETEQPGRSPDLDERASGELRSVLDSLVSGNGAGGGSIATLGGDDEVNLPLAAGGEVVLAAGALGSPQLLQLSGIGDPAVLKAAGVPLQIANESVGKGLQDHAAVTVAYDSTIRDGMSEIKPWMPWLNIISPFALYKWAMHGAGILSTTFCDHGAFVRSDAKFTLPDIQLRFVPGIGPDPDGVKAYELLGKGVQHTNYGFTIQVINCRPKSVGSVSVVSSDPNVAPEIRCNYLTEAVDTRAILAGITLARKIATTGALGEVSNGEVYPGAHVQGEKQIAEYVRTTAHSANGLSGGCCIGTVVNQMLTVIGVSGLRVADASVMPSIVGSQLALPTTAIAERAARIIMADSVSAGALHTRSRASKSPPRRQVRRAR